MTQIFSRRGTLSIAAFLAVATLAGCGSDTTAPPTGATTLTAAASPAASGQIASAIPGPTVTVTSGGAPVAGVLVSFKVTSGGGAVQYPTVLTDASGTASAGLWQLGPKTGTNTLAASAPGATDLTFTSSGTPGAPYKVAAIGGDNQAGAPGSTLPNPLVARVVDIGGNAKSGLDVTFAVTLGGGSIADPTTSATDANGDATSGLWTLGSGQCLQHASATQGSLSTIFNGNSRSSIAEGGTAAGTLDANDCVVGGGYTDEYDLTTTSDAVQISQTSTVAGAKLNVMTSDNSAEIATASGATGSLRLIAADGSKSVAVTGDAGATGAYTVSVASTSSDVNDCSTTYMEIGASTDQTLAPTDCISYAGVAGDAFLVYIPKGVTVKISQTAQPLDALIAFFDPAGKLIQEHDFGGVGASGTEVITYTAATSGYHKVVASSYCLVYDDTYQANCDYGAYTLSIVKP